uniref:EF-hand domain-containing protein n=1 Tax=Hanusia phi TaxID=3032 RepID=A0A7S0E1E1_9CRYP|mmetsp:Transcript_14847/g.34143  ORF Transcript_14847/g.34143 Transcript_14847/m.34143 type:complete len:390 (+) Transcript_14847:36-1205(+)
MPSASPPNLELDFRQGGAHKEHSEVVDGKANRKQTGFHANRTPTRRFDRHILKRSSSADNGSFNITVHGSAYVRAEEACHLSSAPVATWDRLKEALHAEDETDCGLIAGDVFIRVLQGLDLGLTENENDELKHKYRRGDRVMYREFLDNISAILQNDDQHRDMQKKSAHRKNVPKILYRSTSRNSQLISRRPEMMSSDDDVLLAIREKILVAWNKWKAENEHRHKGFSRRMSFKKDLLNSSTRVDSFAHSHSNISEEDLNYQLALQRLFQTFQSILTVSEFERIFQQFEHRNLVAAEGDRQSWSEFLLDFILQKPTSREDNHVLPLMQTLRSQSVPLLPRRSKTRDPEEATKFSRWRPASVADMVDVSVASTPNLPPPSAAWRGRVRQL